MAEFGSTPAPRRLPPLTLLLAALALLGLVLLGAGIIFALREAGSITRPVPPPRPGPVPIPVRTQALLFCTWNAENLCDDQDDPKFHDEIEDWFGRDPSAVQRKLDLLAQTLLRLNDGRGPDILALVEVENRPAVERLRATLNDRLPDEWDYPESGLVHRDNISGRRIEPAILTRLPAREAYPGGFGTRRILGAQIEGPDGSPLLVLASHWTSRLRGEEETEPKREAYAEVLYRTFLDTYRRNPAADVLICGDFNDEPNDPSVRISLRAVGDPAVVRIGEARPYLLDLMAGRDPQIEGTYRYGRRWQILDHIVVSPGLLDNAGWRVQPGSLQVVHGPEVRGGPQGGPLRFGNEHNPNARGPSDHFAVTVRLVVGMELTTELAERTTEAR
jgi:endonuclease/exonuclease/phosphatase family metal-dependent hydrolase